MKLILRLLLRFSLHIHLSWKVEVEVKLMQNTKQKLIHITQYLVARQEQEKEEG